MGLRPSVSPSRVLLNLESSLDTSQVHVIGHGHSVWKDALETSNATGSPVLLDGFGHLKVLKAMVSIGTLRNEALEALSIKTLTPGRLKAGLALFGVPRRHWAFIVHIHVGCKLLGLEPGWPE